ncbi:MAG: hypothetical protein KF795_15675 [Labilithrix sp.]|nr:hypothetical protein [Labilithrix sp.]
MKVRALLALALVPGAVAAGACALLDDPQQCATDGDCARFDAVCDTAQAICIPRGGADGGGPTQDDGAAPAVDAGEDAPPLDPRCDISPKPVASATTGLPAVDGGAQVASTLTLGCDKDWTLDGHLVVPANTTLTIAAGTTIRAKKGTNAAIVVLPGGRIVAEGQRNAPIVLTVDDAAPAPGDWRGVFVLGSAPRNGNAPYQGDPLLAYGGANADDDSGALTFVRIEYAQNGVVFGGVGKKTKIDSVQVRRSNDNCFVFNGGAVDAKHLVCQFVADEQFELQEGYSGRLQFIFGQKSPPGDGHHGLLVDGANTFPVIYNATLCGQAGAANVLGYGMLVRNGTRLDANDLVVTGWFSGLDTTGNLGTPLLLRSSVFFGNTLNPVVDEDGGAGPAADDDNGFSELDLFADGGNRDTDPNLVDCHDPTAPKPWPGVALTAGARTPPNDGFFDTSATFIGAFKDANDAWMTGAWVRFGAD